MGKNKLQKFADMQTYGCVLQYPWHILQRDGFPFRGRWRQEFFHNGNPVVLELGCGKGEYTVELARRNPDTNYIGIDVKGARMWSGASMAEAEGLRNVAFLRAEIEQLESFFSPGEVDEIWITFPDPQMKKYRKRLTSSRFLRSYLNVSGENALIHLKTDSPFLYAYTSRIVRANNLATDRATDDLYGSGGADPVTSIKTAFERQWLSRGKRIKLIEFRLPAAGTEIVEVDDSDIPHDDYRSFPRGIPG